MYISYTFANPFRSLHILTYSDMHGYIRGYIRAWVFATHTDIAITLIALYLHMHAYMPDVHMHTYMS